MPHLTEGELHMVLDGALELLGEERAAVLRSHMEECRDCRRRLEEERGVAERAGALLDDAAPDVGAVPPFGEIRERAAARAGGGGGAEPHPSDDDPTRGTAARFRALRGLSWAASVVLALGVGWAVGRSPGPAPGGPPDGTELRKRATEPGSAARVRQDAAEPSGAAAGRELRRVVAAHVEGSAAVPGLPIVSVAWRDGELHVEQALPGGETLRLVHRRTGGDPAANRLAGRDRSAREGAAGMADRMAEVAPFPAAELMAPEREAGAGPAEDEARTEAPKRARDELDASGASGPRPVVVRRGGWSITGSAPLSPDSLRSLLERLPSPPPD